MAVSARPQSERPAVEQAGELRDAQVESLRALAALSVFGIHAFISAKAHLTASEPVTKLFFGGAYGVYFFFALSGYLLFRPFVRHTVDRARPVDLRSYALNRALRILPLYYVVVAVLLLFEVNGGAPGQWWKFGLFLENFSADTVLRADSPMWSLAVEVHFYVLLPLVAFAVGWLAQGSRARAALAVAGLGAASLILRLATVTFESVPDFRWSFSLATLFFFFAAGMLLALLRLEWQDGPPAWLGGRLASGDAWILASLPFWAAAIWWPKTEPLVAIAAFLVIAGCVLPLESGVCARALSWRPLAVLGIASYSFYLLHVPLLTAITGDGVTFGPSGATAGGGPHDLVPLIAIGLAVVIAAALASYALIESPFLRLRRRWAARTAGSAVPE